MKHSSIFVSLILTLSFAFLGSARCQWTQVKGPYGGSIQCFTQSGSNFFAGSTDGGVFVSTDGGLSWAVRNTGLTNLMIHALAPLGTDIFAGTYGGIFRSTDSGAHWSAVNNGLSNLLVSSLITSGPNIFAYTNEPASFMSTNNGTNWTRVTTGSRNIYPLVDSGSRLYAIATNDSTVMRAVFISYDHGVTWQSADAKGTINIVKLVVHDSELIAVSYDGLIARSVDNGASWIQNGIAPHASSIYSFLLLGNDMYVSSGDGSYRSTDQGATWTPLPTNLAQYARVFALQPIEATLFAGTEDFGVLRSTDSGATWKAINNGLGATDITVLAGTAGNIYINSPKSSGIVTTDQGATWNPWNPSEPESTINTVAEIGGHLLASSDSGLFRSWDHGLTWAKISTRNNIVSFAASGGYLLAATGWNAQIIRSSDDGTTWPAAVFTDEVYGIFTLTATGDNLCAATSSGMYLSTDVGTTWHPSNAIPQFSRAYAAVTLGSHLFAATDNGVFISNDKFTDWIRASNGLPDTIITALVANGNVLFAGSQNGNVFISRNSGANWTSISSGLQEEQISGLTVSGATLYAGTSGAGLWKRPLSEFANEFVQASCESAGTITLSPNPTKGVVTFSNLPSGVSRLTVVNILGQTILQIPANDRSTVTLDFSTLPAGSYYARFESASVREKRLVVKE